MNQKTKVWHLNMGNRMGVLKFTKSNKVYLKETSFDEKWLQKVIADDPTIIGLGDLVLIERERLQPRGRLDLLLADYNSEVRYVTEIQLGVLDESHIIRAIEYWDVERRRFPNKEHIAVIIAEDITSRFLNVLSHFSNSLPIIAIQMDCRAYADNLFINFLKVLDYVEQLDEEEENAEITDRSYWVSRSNQESISIFDLIVRELESIDKESYLTYNKHHVAFGGSGKRNYAWFRPRKSNFLNFTLRFCEEDIEKQRELMEQLGVQILSLRKNKVTFNLKTNTINKNMETFRKILNASLKSAS